MLLPVPGTDAAQLGRLGLKVAHPEAAHPLLEKLGASAATPRAVLATPQVRTAVAASADVAGHEVWDEDALTAAGRSSWKDLETGFAVPAGSAKYVAVEALDAAGKVLATSSVHTLSR